MKHFAPFRIHPSPSFWALVWMAAASDPALGSVIAKHAHRGRSGSTKGSAADDAEFRESGSGPRDHDAAIPVGELFREEKSRECRGLFPGLRCALGSPMGSSVPTLEAMVEVGVPNRDGSTLPVGFDAHGTNLLSSPDSQCRQRVPGRLVE